MATVLSRNTKKLIKSAHTPDYNTQDWIINPNLSSLKNIPKKYWKIVDNLVVEMSQEEKGIVDALLAPTLDEQINSIIEDAENFAKKIKKDFLRENIKLGITQLGLTNHIRKTLREVGDALDTGSLYDAIYEISIIALEDLDPQILTATRLLAFRNKIETKLESPLALAYNE